MNRLRVLAVEDSATIRAYLVGVLRSANGIDDGFEVVGEATDGREGAAMCAHLRPDVATMDMMMPEWNGLQATEQIMAYCPTPILVVSSSTNRGNAFRTYDALAAVAVDILDKPNVTEPAQMGEARLLQALRMVARIKVRAHPRGKLQGVNEGQGETPVPNPAAHGTKVIATGASIGASTGGPAAIVPLPKDLPKEYPVPVLVVLHISELFAFAFAEWLMPQIALPVRLAEDGEVMLRRGRPAIDELFGRVARVAGATSAMLLLTGMGRDGAAGLLAGQSAGATTIAQDEASSIVYGMPGEAVRMGAARQVMNLDQMAQYRAAIGFETARSMA